MKETPSIKRIKKLESEWHQERNGVAKLSDFKFGAGFKAWWRCPVADDHEWQARIVNRIDGSECPVCAGRLVVGSTCLETTHPEVAKLWHPTRNGDCTPKNVYGGTERSAWWQCPKGADHIWKAQIKNVALGGRCPFCNGKKVVHSTSIATTHPHLTEEWHPSKNGSITPENVVSGSDKKVWWLCKINPNHEWISQVKKRALLGQGCPQCSGRIADETNNLAVCYPEIAKQWHSQKNGDLSAKDVLPRSNKKVWWICNKDTSHNWASTVSNRLQGFGCSICAGRTAHPTNSLETLKPETSKLWHPTKNGTLMPDMVVANSNKVVWWQCPEGDDHEWRTSPSNVKGCPVCRGLKVVSSNCLKNTHPDLAKEWHYDKNVDKTPDNCMSGSHSLVWWKCQQNPSHEWKTSIKNRARLGHCCPFCRLTNQSKQELSILFELKRFFPSMKPEGHKFRFREQLWTLDMFIEELNLGIEYDGSYWHRDKIEDDIRKNGICEKKGFIVIRIREEPLKPVSENDVVSNQPFDVKNITDNILKYIANNHELPLQTKRQIEEYWIKGEPQASNAMNSYLRKFFTKNKIYDVGRQLELFNLYP